MTIQNLLGDAEVDCFGNRFVVLKTSLDWRKIMSKMIKNNGKSKRLNRISKREVGTITALLDKNKNFLVVGEEVRYGK